MRRLHEGSTAINYKKYVKTLIESTWDEMPEKIRITDKGKYVATVYTKNDGSYSFVFSVDQFRGLKRFALPHVVFHELGHVWDYWKHGQLVETIEQRRKDELYADLCGLELLIDAGVSYPILRSVVSTTLVAIQVLGFRRVMKYLFIWDEQRHLHPHPFVRAWYMWKHGMKYKKRKREWIPFSCLRCFIGNTVLCIRNLKLRT